jgi:hypothetical protein
MRLIAFCVWNTQSGVKERLTVCGGAYLVAEITKLLNSGYQLQDLTITIHDWEEYERFRRSIEDNDR